MRRISTRSIPVPTIILSTLWRVGKIRSGCSARPQSPSKLPMTHHAVPRGGFLCQTRPGFVRLRNNHHAAKPSSDKAGMRINWAERGAERTPGIPWALEMKAVSLEEPSRLVKTLTGGILGCGGWVLSRGASDSGLVNLLFEFERHACLDIYSVLIAAGLELSQSGHIRFTELCQCTRSREQECATEIASVDLEIQTFPSALVSRGTPQISA